MQEVADSYYTPPMWELVRTWSHSQPIGCVVEIGSYEGMWASGLLSRFKVERYFAVDPWQGEDGEKWDGHLRQWMRNLDEWLWSNLFPLRGTSEEWARVCPYPIDLLYIDGLHAFPSVLGDLLSWYPKLREGGLIIGHDLNNRNVRTAAKEFFGHYDVVKSGPVSNGVVTPAFWKIKQCQQTSASR